MTGERCRGGKRCCRKKATAEGRRCAECEYQFSQTETQKRLSSEAAAESLRQIARQVALMDAEPETRCVADTHAGAAQVLTEFMKFHPM